jgi:ArsR family transcriptional regulator, arsenate/arsenite/antimonite-responsive transcriptional repressor
MKLIQTVEACCPVVAPTPLRAEDAARVAEAFKVLADPHRLQLLTMIASTEEACVCDLTDAVGLTQPTVSHHLKVLNDAGFVSREKRGTWAYYRLVPDALSILRAALTPAG